MTGEDPIKLKDPTRLCLESGECSRPYKEACSSNCPRYLESVARQFRGKMQNIGSGCAYITENEEDRFALKVSHWPDMYLDGEVIKANGIFIGLNPKNDSFNFYNK